MKIEPGQQELTPEQEAEARRFFVERIQEQLSAEPVDEQEAEALLKQAYAVAGFAAPQDIHWLSGPLQLVAVLAPQRVGDSVWDRMRASSMWASVGDSVEDIVEASVWDSVEDSRWASVRNRVRASMRANVEDSVGDRVGASVQASVGNMQASVRASVWDSVGASVGASVEDSVWNRVVDLVAASVRESVQAYFDADWLAFSRFFDVYLAPNDLHALAHFNELVSGYWLGEEAAILVRRPKRLTLDAEGRLHNATSKCLEYRDDWGFYAWHGVRVPEQVILAPEQLTREDWSNARNVEVRRVIQERMGERFVSELGGQVIDAEPQGTLYEVRLPDDDPERVARYVQVQDASTSRQYFLRVPPTIQTVAEAVAWSFNLSVEEYHPTQET